MRPLADRWPSLRGEFSTTKELNMTAVAERHYRVGELAKLWGLSHDTISRLFRDEPGVMKIGKGLGRYRRKRPYLTLSIPESVAMRVKTRLSQRVA